MPNINMHINEQNNVTGTTLRLKKCETCIRSKRRRSLGVAVENMETKYGKRRRQGRWGETEKATCLAVYKSLTDLWANN